MLLRIFVFTLTWSFGITTFVYAMFLWVSNGFYKMQSFLSRVRCVNDEWRKGIYLHNTVFFKFYIPIQFYSFEKKKNWQTYIAEHLPLNQRCMIWNPNFGSVEYYIK